MALSTDDFWAGLGGLSQNMAIIYHAAAPLSVCQRKRPVLTKQC